jgi:(2Fe-2S) ferredoxin
VNRVTVTVCRGCCCGTVSKHPDVDHDGQLRVLRAAAGQQHRVRASDCLNVCDRSNVVVVQPTPAARRAGARPVWLGGVLDDGAVAAITEWLADGGPGIAAIPESLASHTFPAPRWPEARTTIAS